MTGIVSTGKTNHVIGILGEKVGNLPFSFVPSLGTNDYK
jgi:hypothetical protein